MVGDMKSITATSISASLQESKTTSSPSSSSLKPGVSIKMIFSGRLQRRLGQFTCMTLRESIPSFSLSDSPDILLKRAFRASWFMSGSGSSQPILTTLHSSSAVMRTWILHIVVWILSTGRRLSRSKAFITDDLPLLVHPTNTMVTSSGSAFLSSSFNSTSVCIKMSCNSLILSGLRGILCKYSS